MLPGDWMPLGTGWVELVQQVMLDKFRHCILQVQDVAMLQLYLKKGSDILRRAQRELVHGTSMRLALYWVLVHCPHHGETYVSNRWASLRTLNDAVAVIRAQGLSEDITAQNVLGVIQEFGEGKSDRDRVDVAEMLLPNEVMKQVTAHMAPSQRLNLQFEELLRNAPNVLTVLVKAGLTSMPKERQTRMPYVPRLSPPPGLGGATQPPPGYDSVTLGALDVGEPCDPCTKAGLDRAKQFYPLKDGSCPIDVCLQGRKPSFYERLKYLWEKALVNKDWIKPFFEEYQHRIEHEDGFAEKVNLYEENRSKGGWKGGGKSGGRGGGKGKDGYLRPVTAAQRTDPHSSSIDIGKTAHANANELMQAAGA